MLYYTGAIEQEGVQKDPSQSLGGYKSSTQIVNGEIHNLFPKIDKKEVVKNKKRIRLIVLKNITNQEMQNVKIWTEKAKYFGLKIGVIEPYYNEKCNKFSFEKLSSDEHLPYQTRLDVYNENSPLIIQNLEIGKMIGIWIRRELDLSQFTNREKEENLLDNMSCDLVIEELEKELENSFIKEQDLFQLHISWD